MCYCKDTHFEAIHNFTWVTVNDWFVVRANAKIHILKQFTTSATLDANFSSCTC